MAGEIASAFVRVRPDTSGFRSELQGSLRGAFGGLTSVLTGVAKAGVLAAGAAGVGALVVTLKSGLSEWRESVKVAAQTEAVIKSTGGAANVTAGEIDALATSLMRKSGVDDEAIKRGENWLLTFGNIKNEVGAGNDIFDQATKATLDLAVAQANAHGTSVDLASASNLVGKALNDPVKGLSALQRVGVTFTEGQRDQIKAMVAAGDVIGAQKVILAELTGEMGGSAEAAGRTLPGQLNILRETFNNLAGEIMSGIVPALQGAVTWVNEHWGEIERVFKATFAGIGWALENLLWPALRATISAGEAVVAWFRSNWGTIESVARTVFSALRTAWESVLRPALSAIIGAGEAVVSWFRSSWPEIRKTFEVVGAGILLVWNPIREAVVGVFRAIKQAWDVLSPVFGAFSKSMGDAGAGVGVWERIRAAITSTFKAIAAVIQGVVDVIGAVWHRFGDDILATVRANLGPLVAIFKDTFRIIADVVKLISALFHGEWGKAWDLFADIVKRAVNVALNIFRIFWNNLLLLVTILGSIALDVGEAILSGILSGLVALGGLLDRTIWTPVRKAVVGVATRVVTFAEGIGTAIVDAVKGGLATLSALGNTIWTEVKDAVTGSLARVASTAKRIGTAVYDGVVDGLTALFFVGVKIVREIGGAIAGIGGQIKDLAVTVGKAIASGIVEGLGGLAAALGKKLVEEMKGALDRAWDWLKSHSPSARTRDEIGRPFGEGIVVGAAEGMRGLSGGVVAGLDAALSAATKRIAGYQAELKAMQDAAADKSLTRAKNAAQRELDAAIKKHKGVADAERALGEARQAIREASLQTLIDAEQATIDRTQKLIEAAETRRAAIEAARLTRAVGVLPVTAGLEGQEFRGGAFGGLDMEEITAFVEAAKIAREEAARISESVEITRKIALSGVQSMVSQVEALTEAARVSAEILPAILAEREVAREAAENAEVARKIALSGAQSMRAQVEALAEAARLSAEALPVALAEREASRGAAENAEIARKIALSGAQSMRAQVEALAEAAAITVSIGDDLAENARIAREIALSGVQSMASQVDALAEAASASRAVLREAADQARAVLDAQRGELRDAFSQFSSEAFRAFDAATATAIDHLREQLDAELLEIDDALSATLARIGEEQAVLTPAEAEIARLEKEREAAGAQERLARARADVAEAEQKGEAEGIARAQKALADVELDQRLAGLRETARAERVAQDRIYEDKRRIAEEEAELDRVALRARFEEQRLALEAERALQRRHLDDRLAALADSLADQGSTWAKAQADILAMFKDEFGPDMTTAGKNLGAAFAKGLRESFGEVSSAAGGLAKLLADYLLIKSPAAKGPLASLDRWWRDLVPTLVAAVEPRALTRALSDLLAPAGPSGLRVALAGEPVASLAAPLDVLRATQLSIAERQDERDRQILAELRRQTALAAEGRPAVVLAGGPSANEVARAAVR